MFPAPAGPSVRGFLLRISPGELASQSVGLRAPKTSPVNFSSLAIARNVGVMFLSGPLLKMVLPFTQFLSDRPAPPSTGLDALAEQPLAEGRVRIRHQIVLIRQLRAERLNDFGIGVVALAAD
ncbi:hypothetical protein CNECB9_4370027 [Cupriavidus necator]|uniref:Uncharacterized protein n=1 Tax=Cupriavidus necator TaxID=106590 RepID=A0A1K0IY91_CUPNE|nr:hypothetical protein CNECB9_4370027 [Cupriavidus necator]